ncbi:MAG: hypothetical protein JW849_08970 [Phycisphaerae bacterium]|nr:hypothetical protein [Phycisphaerae bacterium]
MTKLTLSADEKTIQRAKWIAGKHNTSVSALFSRFVRSMEKREWADAPLGPITKKASGLVSLPKTRSDKKLLADALADRHGRM